MATIYVVTQGEYSDYHIEGVFSTREGAERLKASLDGQRKNEESDIEEYELDERIEDASRTVHHCDLNQAGACYRQDSTTEIVGPRYTFSNAHPKGRWFHGRSAVSPEHALKLAVEARQKWLRDQATRASGTGV